MLCVDSEDLTRSWKSRHVVGRLNSRERLLTLPSLWFHRVALALAVTAETKGADPVPAWHLCNAIHHRITTHRWLRRRPYRRREQRHKRKSNGERRPYKQHSLHIQSSQSSTRVCSSNTTAATSGGIVAYGTTQWTPKTRRSTRGRDHRTGRWQTGGGTADRSSDGGGHPWRRSSGLRLDNCPETWHNGRDWHGRRSPGRSRGPGGQDRTPTLASLFSLPHARLEPPVDAARPVDAQTRPRGRWNGATRRPTAPTGITFFS